MHCVSLAVSAWACCSCSVSSASDLQAVQACIGGEAETEWMGGVILAYGQPSWSAHSCGMRGRAFCSINDASVSSISASQG